MLTSLRRTGGAVAQLGARLDGIEEVVGSNPIGSTNEANHYHSSNLVGTYKFMAKLTFLGAAGCVTGSRYLVEAAGKRLLVDCGIFQGLRELTERNFQPLSVDPKTFDYVVLTHAHLDHTGWLPVLVKAGYRGPIYANPATMDLTAILLKDSAHLQEEDLRHAQRHPSQHSEEEPLYVTEDVDPVLKLMKPMPRLGAF